VLVVEAAETPGGGMRTQELTLPGYRHDVCSAVHPTALASPYFRSLPLEENGVRWIQPDFPVAHPLEDGRAAVQDRSVETTAQRLGADGDAYRKVYQPLVKGALNLYDTLLAPLRIPRKIFPLPQFGRYALFSAVSFAKFKFKTEEARALFAGHAAHSVQALENEMTAAVGMMLALTGHHVGWPVAEGGSEAIATALVRIFQSHGGEIVCQHKVRSLGELPAAKAYLFDTAPSNLARICRDRLPDGYRRALHRYRHGPAAFKVDWALSEPIPWQNEDCRRAGTIHVGGTLEEVAKSERDSWKGRHPRFPFLIMSQPTVFDPTRAPEGGHIAWGYCHVPYGSGSNMLARVEAQIERFAPGFQDCILEHRTWNSAQLETYNPNYVGGDIVTGVQDWRQLYTRPVARLNPYTTPAKDIFICSAATPPGAGVHGMCGYYAAQAAAKRI